jgi:hypothetical protein
MYQLDNMKAETRPEVKRKTATLRARAGRGKRKEQNAVLCSPAATMVVALEGVEGWGP